MTRVPLSLSRWFGIALLLGCAGTAVGQPAITLLSPSSATAGGPGFTLTVNGTGFVGTSVVNWNGSPLTTTFVSATQLTAAVAAAQIAAVIPVSVTVVNPGPVTSNAVAFTDRKSVV